MESTPSPTAPLRTCADSPGRAGGNRPATMRIDLRPRFAHPFRRRMRIGGNPGQDPSDSLGRRTAAGGEPPRRWGSPPRHALRILFEDACALERTMARTTLNLSVDEAAAERA